MEKQQIRILVRGLLIEFAIYGVLLVIYLFTVLQMLDEWLTRLFNTQLVAYAFLGLGLIVAQGMLLDTITYVLVRWLKLDRPEQEQRRK